MAARFAGTDRHPSCMSDGSRVRLPAGVAGTPFEVFVNGIRQEPGRDFTQDADELVFPRRLAKEGRLGMMRWTSLLLGIAGTYRQNDSVDVVYEAGGRRVVATGLPIAPDRTPDDADAPRPSDHDDR